MTEHLKSISGGKDIWNDKIKPDMKKIVTYSIVSSQEIMIH